MRKYLPMIALAVMSLAPAAPAAAGARIYVRIGPPAPVVEERIIAPSPRHVWIGGYHRWDGRAYVWVPGRWELPPSRYRTWVPGHWVRHQRNGYYWVDGHWRR